MKNVVWLLILGLAVAGVVQTIGGALRRGDFDGKLHDIATQVGASNHDEIKQHVVAEASKLHLHVTPSDVDVKYTSTSDLGMAQRMVSPVGSFQNHRATIAVDYTQSILLIRVKRHATGTALIESAAQAKRAQPMPE